MPVHDLPRFARRDGHLRHAIVVQVLRLVDALPLERDAPNRCSNKGTVSATKIDAGSNYKRNVRTNFSAFPRTRKIRLNRKIVFVYIFSIQESRTTEANRSCYHMESYDGRTRNKHLINQSLAHE